MSSSLARQLNRLQTQTPSNPVPLTFSAKPVSLLFDSRTAATLDYETVLSIGWDGLKELMTLDPRFSAFTKDLFNQESLNISRDTLTRADNAKLNEALESFILLLAPHFLLKSAQKAFEFLLRRYNIHVYNVEAVLQSLICYHDSVIFPKVAGFMNIGGTHWEFLKEFAQTDLPPPASKIVAACQKMPSLFDVICRFIKKTSETHPKWKQPFSFYLAVAVQLVTENRSDQIDSFLLPSLIVGLKAKKAIQFKHATFGIISCLASTSKLNPQVLKEIMENLFVEKMPIFEHALQCLIILCNKHKVTNFSKLLMSRLMSNEVIPTLEEMKRVRIDLSNFLMPFMTSLLAEIGQPSYREVLEELIEKFPVQKQLNELIPNLISTMNDKSMHQDDFQYILISIQRKYPTDLDLAFNSALEKADATQSKRLMQMSSVLTGMTVVQEAKTTLFLALQHPLSKFRMLALDQYSELPVDQVESYRHLEDVVMARLSDDSDEVVAKVLGIPDLSLRVEPDRLLPHLVTVLREKKSPVIQQLAMDQLTTEPIFNPENIRKIFPVISGLFLGNSGNENWKKLVSSASKFRIQLFSKLKSESTFQHLLETFAVNVMSNPTVNLSIMSEAVNSRFLLDKSFAMLVLATCLTIPNIKEEYVLSISKELIQVCLPYLSGNETVPSIILSQNSKPTDDLIDCIRMKKKGSRLGCVLFTLETVIQALPVPSIKLNFQETPTLNLLSEIFRALASGNIFQNPMGKNLLKSMLKRHFSTNILAFFAHFWTTSEKIPQIVRLRALNLSDAFMRTYLKDKTIQQFDFQLVIPSLLLALNSGILEIRKTALEIFGKLQAFYRNLIQHGTQALCWRGEGTNEEYVAPVDALSTFVDDLMKFQSEFLSDGSYVLRFMADPASFSTARNEIESFMLRHLMSLQVESQLMILSCLEKSPSSVKLELTLGTMRKMLGLDKKAENSKKTQGNLPENSKKLHSENEIVAHLMRLFTAATLPLFEKPGSIYFKTMIEILQLETSSSTEQDIAYVAKYHLLSAIAPNFFLGLTQEDRVQLFGVMCQLTLGSMTIRELAREKLTLLPVDAETIISHMKLPSTAPQTPRSRKAAKNNAAQTPVQQLAILEIILELLHHKENIGNFHKILPKLFEILKRLTTETFDFIVAGGSIEYLQQICINAIQGLSMRLIPLMGEREPKVKRKRTQDSLPVDIVEEDVVNIENAYDIPIVIDIMQKPNLVQLHVHCLGLLGTAALLFPNRVLDHVVQLFTFVGESAVKQDDNYMFSVVQETVKSIIPPFISQGKEPFPLLQIFINAFPDISANRRVHLFAVLIEILGASHLANMMLLLFSTHCKREENTMDEKETQIDMLTFGSHLYDVLSTKIGTLATIQSFVTMAISSSKFPKTNAELQRLSKTEDHTFDPSRYTLWELRKTQQLVLEFITDHMCSKDFLNGLLQQTTEEKIETQTLYLNLFKNLLEHIESASVRISEPRGNVPFSPTKKARKKQWKVVKAIAESALVTVQELLAVPGFVSAVTTLLQQSNSDLRQRTLVIFNKKVTEDYQHLTPREVNEYLKLVSVLIQIVQGHGEESDLNRQSALLGLEILARNFCEKKPEDFKNQVVPCAVHALKDKNSQVISSAAICLATLSVELNARMVPILPKFFPDLLRAAEASFLEPDSEISQSRSLLQLSVLSSLEIIIRQLANFLNPYLNSILTAIIHPNIVKSANSAVLDKVQSVQKSLTKSIPSRLLIPAVVSGFQESLKSKVEESTVSLIEFFGVVCAKLENKEVEVHHKKIFTFFMTIFDHVKKKKKDAALTSTAISSYLQFVMKLNDLTFKPQFLQLLDWAIRQNSHPLLFYRIVDGLTIQMKSMAVPYFGYLLDNAVEVVGSKTGDNQLIKTVLSCLTKCFLYDTSSFIDKEKFEKILPALVSQLENISGNSAEYQERTFQYLVPCLAQLAVCMDSEVYWRPLNNQVLLKTRSASPQVRLASLKVIEAMYKKLGEDLLPLLPETIPYLSELMEDSDINVEKLTKDVIRAIEEHLASDDSIANYLER
eukprot:TRINITY_DN5787_c0_g1_i1.p1 TRINITY_DN5787_c0_g1~~TRINITY_DN5787_c0_g1_i1.p1  ORF type:complete len:2043 (-),score=706.93 TRINITY_DN5787_c0_g1_i1:9-6137(-)